MNLSQIIKKVKKRITFNRMNFEKAKLRNPLYLYAGQIPDTKEYEKYIGLTINYSNSNHIKHDITKKLKLPDNCADIYQSEDVFEHINPEVLPEVINEIYRVLKPGGIFRLSLPDYRCDFINQRTIKDDNGKLLFDPDGGGEYKNGKVVKGGHVWFPMYESVKDILNQTKFSTCKFYHYYKENGEAVTEKIDYSIGHIQRTPDFDKRVSNPYRPLSLVVDCIK